MLMTSEGVMLFALLCSAFLAVILCALRWSLRKRDIPRRTLRLVGWSGCVMTAIALITAAILAIRSSPVSPVPGEVPTLTSRLNIVSVAFPFPSPHGLGKGRGVAHIAAFPPLLPLAVSRSLSPTVTPTPSPTPEPTPTPKPPCAPVEGIFAATWTSLQEDLGCATTSPIQGLIAEENFVGGRMFWREPIDYAQALVLFNDGSWEIFQHSPYPEGSPEFSCVDEQTPAQCPPTPKRGFGMMWCDIPAIRNGLGNATDCERGYTGWMQQFERGFMIRTDWGATFVFYTETHRWEQR